MSDIEPPKKTKRLLDAQFKIFQKLKLMILAETEQTITDSNYMKILIKAQRECFKLGLPYAECRKITKNIFRQLIKEYGDEHFLLSDVAIISTIDTLFEYKFITKGSCIII